MNPLKQMKITRLYSKFVFLFIIFSVGLLSFIVYVSFAKTTIIVHPRIEAFSQEFPFDLTGPQATSNNLDALSVHFMEHTVRDSKRVVDLTRTNELSEKAIGEVTLVNNYSKAQPLVATTRLLSRENILFRTLETVTVPAGGRVNVDIIADQPGASGEIPPSHFTIVALWKGLQDQIFAESNTPTKRTASEVTVVTQEDIRDAQEELTMALKEQAFVELEHKARKDFPHLDYLPEAFEQRVLFESTSVPAGIPASTLTVEMEVQWITIVTSQKLLDTKILTALQSALPENKKFAPGKTLSTTYQLTDVDLVQQTGKLVGRAEYPLVISLSHPVLDRSKLTNKDAQEIRSFLASFPEIEDVSVKFSPFWSRQSLPLEGHIEILMKTP